jgi:uncharacterized protein (TIGR03435 family)
MQYALIVGGVLWAAGFVGGQSRPASPEFEVATVKPVESSVGNTMRLNRCTGGPGTSDPTRFMCRSLTLKTLLGVAYGLRTQQISGPGWLDSDEFEIQAKPPEGATQDQIGAMLQSLLKDRFQLQLRRETRTTDILALVQGPGGPRLTTATEAPQDPAVEAAKGAEAGRRARNWGPAYSGTFINDGHMTLDDLADTLSGRLDQPVRNLTGISGEFAISLQFAVERTAAAQPDNPDAPHPPTVFQALQDQLGLRLESRKGPADFIIVESASRKPRQ